MNWKLILVGGLVFWAVTFVVSLGTGAVIHGQILEPAYQETNAFWQPALRSDPPDMAALMPRWIAVGIAGGFVFAAIFGWVRGGLTGAGWMKGLQFGLILTLIGSVLMMGQSGVFNLPGQIWLWWMIEQPLVYLPGGAALGWVAERMVPT